MKTQQTKKAEKKPHVCLTCGCDMSDRHHAAKFCHDCAKQRMQDSNKVRNGTRKFVGGQYIKTGEPTI